MKVRLDNKKIRFRISEKELVDLATYKTIVEFFEFPDGSTLCFNLELGDNLKEDISFRVHEEKYTLFISRKALTFLQENPNLKSGCSISYLKKDGILNTISIEVDILSL